MFPLIEPVRRTSRSTPDYVEGRARWEPIYEVTQTKGDGETHPFLSPNDEFADFETWDKANLDHDARPTTTDMLESEYARSALKNGLELEQVRDQPVQVRDGRLDRQPHRPRDAVEEDNFFGKMTPMEPGIRQSGSPMAFMQRATSASHHGMGGRASGYTAVWATENTREAIFDAMERRETYATTGPRMVVRLFGGWDFVAEDATEPHPAASATPGACRWAAICATRPEGSRRRPSSSPRCATRSAPTSTAPDRQGLDRRRWRTFRSRSTTSPGRTTASPARMASCPPVGSTVDVENATWPTPSARPN
jgi:hypothetical protein